MINYFLQLLVNHNLINIIIFKEITNYHYYLIKIELKCKIFFFEANFFLKHGSFFNQKSICSFFVSLPLYLLLIYYHLEKSKLFDVIKKLTLANS